MLVANAALREDIFFAYAEEYDANVASRNKLAEIFEDLRVAANDLYKATNDTARKYPLLFEVQ